MDEIITDRSESILRVELNRPEKKNAMTSRMYVALADILNAADKEDDTCVVLWYGAGDSFCAGNDIEDFLKNPPGPGESPQARLMNALVDFDKPLIAAVQGAAIGGGTTMLLHCDFVYAGENAKFLAGGEFPVPVVQPGGGAGLCYESGGSGDSMPSCGARRWQHQRLSLGRQPEEGAVFTNAMHGLTSGIVQDVTRVVDTSTTKLAVDIGGASGTLVHSLMTANPQLHGIILDLPDVVPSATAAIP